MIDSAKFEKAIQLHETAAVIACEQKAFSFLRLGSFFLDQALETRAGSEKEAAAARNAVTNYRQALFVAEHSSHPSLLSVRREARHQLEKLGYILACTGVSEADYARASTRESFIPDSQDLPVEDLTEEPLEPLRTQDGKDWLLDQAALISNRRMLPSKMLPNKRPQTAQKRPNPAPKSPSSRASAGRERPTIPFPKERLSVDAASDVLCSSPTEREHVWPHSLRQERPQTSPALSAAFVRQRLPPRHAGRGHRLCIPVARWRGTSPHLRPYLAG